MDHRKIRPSMIIRRLDRADHADICDHFRLLDAASRRTRFIGAVSGDGVTNYANGIFRHDDLLYGAFIDGRLRGLAELRGNPDSWPYVVEAAFSVEPDWQNIGIGDALFERIITIARNRRISSIALMFLKENDRMRHLAAKHQARLHVDIDAIEAILHPSRPTPIPRDGRNHR